MGFMLEFISKYGTAGIVLFGIAVAILLFWNGIDLSNQKGRIEEALRRKNSTYTLNVVSGVMAAASSSFSSISFDTTFKV